MDRRAVYTNGELVILHTILHRHALKPFNARLSSTSPDNPQSIRQAMLDNADIPVAYDRDMSKSGVQQKTFKDLVSELYTILEGLMAESIDVSVAGMKLNLDWKDHVQGWEYMDLVNRKLSPRLREAELKSTCGQWPKLARCSSAIVLFANGFHNILTPHPSIRLCQKFQELPKFNDYLAIESERIEKMYEESGAEMDHTQLTLGGLQIRGFSDMFEGCPEVTSPGIECDCDRIQQLITTRGSKQPGTGRNLGSAGAVIIGKEASEIGRSLDAVKKVFTRYPFGKKTNSSKSKRQRNSLGVGHSNHPISSRSNVEVLSNGSSNTGLISVSGTSSTTN